MPEFTSQIDPTSTDFKANCESMAEFIDRFHHLEKNRALAAAKVEPKFAKLGKLLPRQRIDVLLDKSSFFLELSSLAGYGMEDDKDGSFAGGGIIGGIGKVSGAHCLIVANNSAIKGGVISPTGLGKTLRLQQIAMENKLPIITLAESGGANLNYASEIFVEGARAFANQARISALGIPQITVVHGNATAGGAYQPGLSDYVIVIRNQSKMFLAGPPLLYAATGEIATDEDLGGAQMHAEISGTAEYIAESDEDAIDYARDLIARLEPRDPSVHVDHQPPKYPLEDLLGIVPRDPKTPYDVREIIARLVDGSDFLDFKATYDLGTVCGYARIYGMDVGIIGNNGPLTCDGSCKAAQFIQLCDQAQIPLVFLHNTTGFLVGTASESGGIIKHGSKMIQAVTNARIPKISIILGGSYGAGNYAMCGRGFDPRFIFTWPNSRVSVMGGVQAAKVMRMVTEEKLKRQGMPIDQDRINALQKATIEKFDQESSAFYGTARLWDDGIIHPLATRKVLGIALEVSNPNKSRKRVTNSFGISRF